ncbi:MAG: hypothetical protein L3J29_07750 [Cyclobacteriaceae bacterium]|nr:hypothetical protein [Cyclobacteriaceae bacterium]
MKTIISLIILFLSLSVSAQNSITKCWLNQVKPIQNEYVTFSYVEKRNELGHNFEPWQQTKYEGKGLVWSNANNFIKQDTLRRGKRKYYSSIVFNSTELLHLDYGDNELLPVTKESFANQVLNTARYTPTNILNYFLQNEVAESKESNSVFAVYTTTINKTIVKLYIRKFDNLLQKVTILKDDELFGDVLTTIHYSSFVKTKNLYTPQKIQIEKINGKVQDEVLIGMVLFAESAPAILQKPKDYALVEIAETQPELQTEKLNENIHFLELKHTNDRVMIVEFSTFLVVAEAPLNSENGELIIAEAKKIAPNKPIKYFVFGHYHPHYLGGIRPFIHKGASIICSDVTKEYVTYIANAPHTLNPDSLQVEPKPLVVEVLKDSLLISDGEFDMMVYFIGEKSAHTKGYLIYYFPSLHLLFQDDLVWIKKEGEPQKARKRQAGLYKAILDLNIDVETIIQSWPVNNQGVKTVIPFNELKATVDLE